MPHGHFFVREALVFRIIHCGVKGTDSLPFLTDVIHDITLNVERVIYGYYQVYCPWESRLIQDTIPDLRDSDYLYRFYGFQPTISETVESVFDPMNESLLRELFMSLQKCIVIRRELELEAQIRPEEEKWVRKHPEVKNQFDFNGIGALRQRLKKEERRLQFEIFSIVSELIDNLEMMFPVTETERKASVQTTEINHLLAEKRSKRDIEYMEETISEEEYIDAFYEEDEPLLWSVFEDGV